MKDYAGVIRIAHKTLLIHPQVAMASALALCAADQQGKAQEMEELIWAAAWPDGNRSVEGLSSQNMEKLAQKLKLNMEKFKKDMSGEGCRKDLEDDARLLSQLGVGGTPAFFINGRPFLEGAVPIERFKVIIEEEIKKADGAIASGMKPEEYYAHIVKTGKTKAEVPAQ